MKLRVLAVLPLLLLLAACGTSPVKPIIVEQRVEAIPVFHPPLPDPIELQNIKWKVLTPEIMKQYLQDLEEGKAPIEIWYGLTPSGYEALAENIAILKKYIKSQQAIILYYRENLKQTVPPSNPTK